MNVSLARQFELPKRQLVGHWERRRATSKSHFIQVPMETRPMKMSGPQQVTLVATNIYDWFFVAEFLMQ
jgi:hypothetical protein